MHDKIYVQFHGILMNMHTWWTFLVAAFLICSTPGPNMLMVMTSSVRYGTRRALFTMVGCYSGVIVLITASVAGLGALLTVEPVIFNTLRIAGAAYLIYLGIKAWRAPIVVEEKASSPSMHSACSPLKGTSPSASPYKTTEHDTIDAKAIYRKGFLVGISNPKAILFAAAFFPQFINPDMPKLPQFLILLATFSMAEFCCYLAYATGGSSLSSYLKRARVQKIFNRAIGGLFSAFGLSLLCAKI